MLVKDISLVNKPKQEITLVLSRFIISPFNTKTIMKTLKNLLLVSFYVASIVVLVAAAISIMVAFSQPTPNGTLLEGIVFGLIFAALPLMLIVAMIVTMHWYFVAAVAELLDTIGLKKIARSSWLRRFAGKRY